MNNGISNIIQISINTGLTCGADIRVIKRKFAFIMYVWANKTQILGYRNKTKLIPI